MSLNKYQIVFAVCLAFFIFTAKRSYSPFPDYQIPSTQIVKKRPLPDMKVEVEAILARAAPWSLWSRHAFLVHPNYEAKIIQPKKETKKVAPSVPPPPTQPAVVKKTKQEPLTPVDVFVKATPRETPTKVIKLVEPPKPPPPPRIIPPKPQAPRKGRVRLTDVPFKKRHRPRIARTSSKTPGKQPAKPEEKPYELPLQFQGVISAGSTEGPMVILRDKNTGRVFRRKAGQTYNGIRIEKVSPSGVEVNVPAEGLRFRYLDRARKWRQL